MAKAKPKKISVTNSEFHVLLDLCNVFSGLDRASSGWKGDLSLKRDNWTLDWKGDQMEITLLLPQTYEETHDGN